MVLHRKYLLFTFDLDLVTKVKQNNAPYPLHHVTYVPVKIRVAVFNGLGDVFTRKKIILPLTLTEGHTQHSPVPSIAWDLCTSVVRLFIFHNRSSKIIGQEVSIDDRL